MRLSLAERADFKSNVFNIFFGQLLLQLLNQLTLLEGQLLIDCRTADVNFQHISFEQSYSGIFFKRFADQSVPHFRQIVFRFLLSKSFTSHQLPQQISWSLGSTKIPSTLSYQIWRIGEILFVIRFVFGQDLPPVFWKRHNHIPILIFGFAISCRFTALQIQSKGFIGSKYFQKIAHKTVIQSDC